MHILIDNRQRIYIIKSTLDDCNAMRKVTNQIQNHPSQFVGHWVRSASGLIVLHAWHTMVCAVRHAKQHRAIATTCARTPPIACALPPTATVPLAVECVPFFRHKYAHVFHALFDVIDKSIFIKLRIFILSNKHVIILLRHMKFWYSINNA